MTYICTASLMSCNILSWLLVHGSLSLLHFSVYYLKRVMLCLAVFSHTPVSSSLCAYMCLLFNSIFLKNLVGGCVMSRKGGQWSLLHYYVWGAFWPHSLLDLLEECIYACSFLWFYVAYHTFWLHQWKLLKLFHQRNSVNYIVGWPGTG